MIIQCPLCNSEKIFSIRQFDVSTLRQEWISSFKFDPFNDFLYEDSNITNHRCGECELEFFSPIFTGDSNLYEILSKNDWYYEQNKWEFDEAINRLASNKNISSLLEIGCGKGFFLEKVSNVYQTLGIEINGKAIDICRQKKLNVCSQTLEEITTQFNAIVSFEVLEHIPNPQNFLEKVCKLLSPEGTLILAVPNPSSYLKEFDHVLLDMPPHHSTKWSKKAIEYLAIKYNLELVSISYEPLRYVHYQSYINELILKNNQFTLNKTFIQKFKYKLKDFLMSSLTSAITAQGYQNHKNLLIGQTQLVEYRRRNETT